MDQDLDQELDNNYLKMLLVKCSSSIIPIFTGDRLETRIWSLVVFYPREAGEASDTGCGKFVT